MKIYGYFCFTGDNGCRMYFYGTEEGVLRDTSGGTEHGGHGLSGFHEVDGEEVRAVAPDERSREAIDFALRGGNPHDSFRLFTVSAENPKGESE